MLGKFALKRRTLALGGMMAATLCLSQVFMPMQARAVEPIKIGFSMALTGALAGAANRP